MDDLELALHAHAEKEKVIKRGAQIAFEWAKAFQHNNDIELHTLFMNVSYALYSCKASYQPEQWPSDRGVHDEALIYVTRCGQEDAPELEAALSLFSL